MPQGMLSDLGPFSDEEFDPSEWIKLACQALHPQDSLEKHLLDLEMNLQMPSKEIEASLEEESAVALLLVSRDSDVVRLCDDAVSHRRILPDLEKSMLAAYKTLQDVADLTQLSSTVEDVLASRDLPRAADTLANMRHCLSSVGEVAEFADFRKQLKMLEDWLDNTVQRCLTDTLSNHKVEVAQVLPGILICIGEFKSLELQYTKFHMEPIYKLWGDFDSKRRANKNETERLSSSTNFQQNV